MLQNLNLFQVALLSLVIGLTLSWTFFKIRSAILGRHVLETKMSTMKVDYVYTFVYRHSFLNGRRMEIIVPNDETSYILTETTYYNNRSDVSISVFAKGVMMYNAELRNVIYRDFEPIGEEEFDGNL